MQVYLDNAATTPMDTQVIEAMHQVMKHTFGNPSSTHAIGRQAKSLIETARRTIAQLLNCKASEIVFTSGGTEADNMAIHASVHQMGAMRIITTPLEHHAVVHSVKAIEKHQNIQVDIVKTNEKGQVDLIDLEQLLSHTQQKTLVSLMHANNEIGTLLSLEQVSELCRKYNALFHSDTVQTMGHYCFDLQALDIDFITCAAHKFHGPKGVGFLYCNSKNKVAPLIHGGSQERGRRGGTENVYGIVGLEKAMQLAYQHLSHHQQYIQGLKDSMITQLRHLFEHVKFNGTIDPHESLYTVLNVQLPPTQQASMILFTLDLKGIAVSGGSACSAGSNEGSHVLQGIGVDTQQPNVRFSFSRHTTQQEIDYTIEQLSEIYQKIPALVEN